MIPERLAALADRPAVDLSLDDRARMSAAAVLMLLWEHGGELELLLTRRAQGLRTQPGDIALPGGRCDPGETAEQAARREAREEVGLDPEVVAVVGRFDEAWSSARSRVVPVVGWTEGRPDLRPAPDEVDEIIIVPVAELADPDNLSTRVTPAGAREYRDDIITLAGVVVHGFTADLVLDLTSWLAGIDRRSTDRRMADLDHFSASRGWW